MSVPSISVIVPVYNSERTIRRVLEAIVNQKVLSRIEIVVVDDGSNDNTALIVKSFPQVKYFHQTNQGPAAARNHGARSAQGDILFFTDSDCVPAENWIASMLPYFEKENAAVVAGSYGIANPANRLAQGIQNEIMYRHNRMPESPSYFGSFNFAVRREIFLQAGGFNESYRHASGEDNDLSYRIKAGGHKIYFAKNSLVYHFHTERVGKYLKEQSRHGFWRVKMYLDHPKMSRGDDYTFWKDIVEIPLSFLLLALLIVSIFVPVAGQFFAMTAALFLLIEIYFGFKMTQQKRSFKNVFFWALVMSARAFYRSFGFLAGAFRLVLLRLF